MRQFYGRLAIFGSFGLKYAALFAVKLLVLGVVSQSLETGGWSRQIYFYARFESAISKAQWMLVDLCESARYFKSLRGFSIWIAQIYAHLSARELRGNYLGEIALKNWERRRRRAEKRLSGEGILSESPFPALPPLQVWDTPVL